MMGIFLLKKLLVLLMMFVKLGSNCILTVMMIFDLSSLSAISHTTAAIAEIVDVL